MLAPLVANLCFFSAQAVSGAEWDENTWKLRGDGSIQLELLKDPMLHLERDTEMSKWYPTTNVNRRDLKSFAMLYGKDLATGNTDLYAVFSTKDRSGSQGLPNPTHHSYDPSERLSVFYANKIRTNRSWAQVTLFPLQPRYRYNDGRLAAVNTNLEREGVWDTTMSILPWVLYGVYYMVVPTKGKIEKQDEKAVAAMLKECLENPNIENRVCAQFQDVPESLKFSSAMADLEKDLQSVLAFPHHHTALEKVGSIKKLRNWGLYPWGMLIRNEAYVPEKTLPSWALEGQSTI